MSGHISQEGLHLICLLRSALHCEAAPVPAPPRDLDWQVLHRLAARHGVVNLAYYGLQCLARDQQPPAAAISLFQQSHRRALAREATQHLAVEQILSACEQQGIACLPVKGYLLKQLYPRPDMRAMADIDILVRGEQTESVKPVMLDLGYCLQHQGGNHDVYHRQPYLNVEIHRRLVAESSPYSAYMSRTWQRALRERGWQQVYRLSPEDHYVYLLVHLAKHFASGGTGLRPFLDIWVHDRHHGATMDWSYVESELTGIKLSRFASSIRGLAAAWFGAGVDQPPDQELLAFILESGSYGTRQHAILACLSANRSSTCRQAKLDYWRQWLFPPAATLQTIYPWLTTWPALLPAAWMLRAGRSLWLKPRQLWKTAGHLLAVSPQQVAEMERLQQRVGLQ